MNYAAAKRVGIVSGACVSVIALVGAARPIMSSDAPPWASISRVSMSQDRVEAIIVRGNMMGAWRACRQAMREGNKPDADDFAAQISMLQAEYEGLTGLRYPIPDCP